MALLKQGASGNSVAPAALHRGHAGESSVESPWVKNGKSTDEDHGDDEASSILELGDLEELDGPLDSSATTTRTTYKRETVVLLGYLSPLLISQLAMRYSSTMGPVSAAGRFGPDALAGAAIANTTYNVLFVATIFGFTGALDTLSTQAEGSKTKTTDLNMLYSMQVLIVLSGCMVCFVPVIIYIETIYTLLGIEAKAAVAGATFISWSSLGLPGFIGYEVLRKYCSASARFFGPAVAGMVAAPIAIPVMRSELFGSNSPPIGLALYFTISFLAELAWAIVYMPSGTFSSLPNWSLVSSDLGIVIKLGLAGVASCCSDWWAWEALSFLAAWLSSDALAAQGILLTSAGFCFALPGSLQSAASTRVGNYLGSGSHKNARLAAYTSLGLGLVIASAIFLVLAANAKAWASFYTQEQAIVELVANAMRVFSLVAFFDAILAVAGGILRAAGLPIEIARIMLMTHYLLGLPLAALCGFGLKGGLMGLWVGFCIGLAIVCARLVYIIVTLDYGDAASKAQAHIDATDALAASASETHV